jgi:hypothetical protein
MQVPIVFAISGLMIASMPSIDDPKLKFSDCPAPVQKIFQDEAPGAKIETVTKEKDDEGETIYWAETAIAGKTYSIGVLEDGTLTEMNLTVEDEDLAFERCPPAVQATFQSEAFGVKIGRVGKDMKYGVTIYETVVDHKGKSYEIVVAEDGTLVEKVLVIEDDEVDLAKCPPAVQAAIKKHANGGPINQVTRYTGIGRHTFEAEAEIKGKVYLIEVAESGLLLSKSLEAAEE